MNAIVDGAMEQLRDRNSIWTLIGDLFDGGARFFTPEAKEVEVLEALGFPAGLSTRGGMNAHDLKKWAGNSTWVIDGEGLYDPTQNSTKKTGLIFACPHRPKVLEPMRTLRVVSQNGSVFVYIEGEEDPACTIDRHDDRWPVRLTRGIKRLASKRKKKPTPMIVIPPAKDGVTTLQKEAVFYRSLADNRLHGYIQPCKTDAGAVLGVILSHTEEQIKLDRFERKDLTRKIGHFMKDQKPIEITISLAIGCRIQNRLKYFEETNMPTLGWAHLAWYFRYIDEKVKRIYAPGIKLIVFDEAILFHEMMGISEQVVRDNLRATRSLIEGIGAPIQIYEMEKELFPDDEIEIRRGCANVAQVYAMVCSLPEMNNKDVMKCLYKSRGRNYGKIRRIVGEELWAKAQRFSDVVVSYLSWRKETKLFQRLGFEQSLDACITDKSGRIVFDITSGLLINHGMPVVRRGQRGVYKIFVLPEYRIKDEFPKAVPIKIDPKQSFGIDGEPYVFYYKEK
jgi:hypothetical protein